MEMPNFFKRESKETYEYFKNKRERKDIYQFSKGLSNYLHEEKIPNIIFIDRSPRPLWVGIDEYWKENYKKEPRPNIYFVNPDGFNIIEQVQIKDDISKQEVLFDRMMFAITGQSIIMKKVNEMDKQIKEQFEKVYNNLEQQKNKPVAIFDNCIHSGDTIIPVLEYLKRNKYEDMRVVIGDTSNDMSPVVIDKEFTNKITLVSCGIFGCDFGVKKNDGYIYSGYDEYADRQKVIQSRKEIRRIVKEKGV